MEMANRKEAIIKIATIIANTIDQNYGDEKNQIIDDLYIAGGQSQYLEDMLFNNGIEGLSNYIDIIDELSQEELTDLSNQLISKLEESENLEESLQLNENETLFNKGDKYSNGKASLEIIDVDTEHLLDGEPQVTYRFLDNSKDIKCYKQSSVKGMLDQNSYKLTTESSKDNSKEIMESLLHEEIFYIVNLEAKRSVATLPGFEREEAEDVYKTKFNGSSKYAVMSSKEYDKFLNPERRNKYYGWRLSKKMDFNNPRDAKEIEKSTPFLPEPGCTVYRYIDKNGFYQYTRGEVDTENEFLSEKQKDYLVSKLNQLKESLQLKTEDENIEERIEEANEDKMDELEENDLTTSEVTEIIKNLINDEKEAISGYNEFLTSVSDKLPKEVYEVVEDEINEIKVDEIEHEEKLKKLYDALVTIAIPEEIETIEDKEQVESEEIENEKLIKADEDDETFEELEEEGLLKVINVNTLAESFAKAKGIELNEELQRNIRHQLYKRYGVLENKSFTLVSKEYIKNKLKTEAIKQKQADLIDAVKEEAKEDALKTGEDTYVYQLGKDIFYANEKPTHTSLVNRVLVIGKYKFGIVNGEPTVTWFEESKEIGKHKKLLNGIMLEDVGNIEGIPDGKEVESIHPIEESKEENNIEEIHQDYEKITLDEYKKANKELIDLSYKNTYGEEIDKDLYDNLAEFMYNDSITGNINTKEDYKTLNDRIEDTGVDTINDERK